MKLVIRPVGPRFPAWFTRYTNWSASICLGPSLVPRFIRRAPLRLAIAVVWLHVWWLA